MIVLPGCLELNPQRSRLRFAVDIGTASPQNAETSVAQPQHLNNILQREWNWDLWIIPGMYKKTSCETTISRSNNDPISNPLLPSSFDRFFPKCTAIFQKTNYRNLKPTNSSEYLYHFLVPPTLFHSEDLSAPTRDFHNFPAAVHSSQSGTSCWFNKLLRC